MNATSASTSSSAPPSSTPPAAAGNVASSPPASKAGDAKSQTAGFPPWTHAAQKPPGQGRQQGGVLAPQAHQPNPDRNSRQAPQASARPNYPRSDRQPKLARLLLAVWRTRLPEKRKAALSKGKGAAWLWVKIRRLDTPANSAMIAGRLSSPMPVVEAPSWDSWPGAEGVPAPNGVFVLVKIDPVASVANLDDEETTRAAAALDRHDWVLGVVLGHSGGSFLDPIAKPVMSLQIELIGQGVPHDKAIASIPIAPSPQLYDDRPPVQPNAPLPWPNLYVHTNYSSSVIISRIHHGSATFEAKLTKEQYEDLFERAFADRYNWHSLPPVTVPAPPETVVVVDPNQPPGSSDYDTEDSSSEDPDSLYAQEREEIGTKVIRRRIYGEISLDPSMCPGPLGAPVQMEEPVRRIRELWAAWEERRMTELLAKRPQTTAWAQGVADAQTVSDSGSEADALEAPVIDDVIMPEDAIDDRVERGLVQLPLPFLARTEFLDRLARAANIPGPSPQTGADATISTTGASPSPPTGLSATSRVQSASDDHAPAGDKDSDDLLKARVVDVNGAAGEVVLPGTQVTSPPTVEAAAPVGGSHQGDVPAGGAPSFGARLTGLMKRVHSAFMGVIASFKRRLTPGRKEPSER
ncbi:hypothetical protein AURDEDRAFT_128507 [Auricularia subglabra TFB-10046 SS5]|uniref:Uncharacterized protein n=1 Tax=Auricularia subglabra (strain TFB-10046 / SS5) TaxID=717982 RepID=J0WVL8_AURST|nr:hypothetical protein AURDEDRAFT_128507 [Auricularia subglabra TFB-10046 SS5]